MISPTAIHRLSARPASLRTSLYHSIGAAHPCGFQLCGNVRYSCADELVFAHINVEPGKAAPDCITVLLTLSTFS